MSLTAVGDHLYNNATLTLVRNAVTTQMIGSVFVSRGHTFSCFSPWTGWMEGKCNKFTNTWFQHGPLSPIVAHWIVLFWNSVCKGAFHFQEELGLRDVTSAVSMLKQASCCGNQDATFLLSVLLNYGLGVKVHEIKVRGPSVSSVCAHVVRLAAVSRPVSLSACHPLHARHQDFLVFVEMHFSASVGRMYVSS